MINLFVNYYVDKNPVRQKEIDKCFEMNILNSHLTMHIIESNDRLKFNDFFKKINQVTGPDDVNIICNSDIYFDESIKLTEKMGNDEAYCLSRWDVKDDGSSELFKRIDSQDVWVCKGPINVKCNHKIGVPGIDNHLSYIFNKAGYKVSNPCKSIKCYHLHLSNERSYSQKDVVPPPYLMLEQS